MLFSNEECIWCFNFRNLHACGYHVPPSVETGCFPWFFITSEMNLSATNMFLSLEIDSARICLFSGSIATHNQMNSNPTLNNVSSMINSEILFLFYNIFLGWYFWIHFQIATWLLLTLRKQNMALATFLVDKPRKYKYNAWPIYDEDVLFLLLIITGIGHLQAISFY